VVELFADDSQLFLQVPFVGLRTVELPDQLLVGDRRSVGDERSVEILDLLSREAKLHRTLAIRRRELREQFPGCIDLALGGLSGPLRRPEREVGLGSGNTGGGLVGGDGRLSPRD
jgi:hypothetical protein